MVGRFEMAKKELNIKSKIQNVKCKSERPFCPGKEKQEESVPHEFQYPISNIQNLISPIQRLLQIPGNYRC